MQVNELSFTTPSGRPLTVTLSFRVPFLDSLEVQREALKRGITVSELLQSWTLEKLSQHKTEGSYADVR